MYILVPFLYAIISCLHDQRSYQQRRLKQSVTQTFCWKIPRSLWVIIHLGIFQFACSEAITFSAMVTYAMGVHSRSGTRHKAVLARRNSVVDTTNKVIYFQTVVYLLAVTTVIQPQIIILLKTDIISKTRNIHTAARKKTFYFLKITEDFSGLQNSRRLMLCG